MFYVDKAWSTDVKECHGNLTTQGNKHEVKTRSELLGHICAKVE